MIALPDTLPAIDFTSYKAKVPVAGMVDEFEKQYKALAASIPYPANTYDAEIDAAAKKYVSFYIFLALISKI